MKHTNRRGGHPHRATTLTIGSLVGLAGVLFLPAFTGLPTPGSTAPDKPLNIIFILSDDHRYDFMGFMKPELAPWLQTPNLDRLRREGAHCNNTFVTTALCSPSRASILTGLYSHQHTVVDNQAPEPPSLTYFPEYLQKAGYETAFIGKWHIGSEDDKPRKGFDHWVSFRGQGVYYNPVLNVDGRQVTHGDSAYTTDVLTDYAINWLKKTAGRPSASGNKPRFLYLSHKAVHENFSPNPADRNLYRSQPTRLPASAAVSDLQLEKSPEGQTYADVPKWVKRQRYSWHGVDFAYHGRDKLDDIVHRYAETLHSMDTSIGRLLAYIDASGMAQNTLVIYMSDNGFMLGDHGLIDKRTAYEESMQPDDSERGHCAHPARPGPRAKTGSDGGPFAVAPAGGYGSEQPRGAGLAQRNFL
jgi:N-acetylglucosamine-6-sulfatase